MPISFIPQTLKKREDPKQPRVWRTHSELNSDSFRNRKGHVSRGKPLIPRNVLALRCIQQKASVALDQHPGEPPAAGRDAGSQAIQSSSGSSGSRGCHGLLGLGFDLGRASTPIWEYPRSEALLAYLRSQMAEPEPPEVEEVVARGLGMVGWAG